MHSLSPVIKWQVVNLLKVEDHALVAHKVRPCVSLFLIDETLLLLVQTVNQRLYSYWRWVRLLQHLVNRHLLFVRLLLDFRIYLNLLRLRFSCNERIRFRLQS